MGHLHELGPIDQPLLLLPRFSRFVKWVCLDTARGLVLSGEGSSMLSVLGWPRQMPSTTGLLWLVVNFGVEVFLPNFQCCS